MQEEDGEQRLVDPKEEDEALHDVDIKFKVELDDDVDSRPPPNDEVTSNAINFHPIMSSLLNGRFNLTQSFPFLAASTAPQLPVGLLVPTLGKPFAQGLLPNSSVDGEIELLSQPMARSSNDSPPSTVTPPPPQPSASPQPPSSQQPGCSTPPYASPSLTPSALHASATVTTTSASSTTPAAASTTTTDNACSPRDQVTSTASLMRRAQEMHDAQMQMLRLSMAQSIAEHDVRMRVLSTQLQYWQRRARVQQRVTDALSGINGRADADEVDDDEEEPGQLP